MASHSSTDRFTQCLIAAAILGGIAYGYVNLSSRWLDVPRHQRRPVKRTVSTEPRTVADKSVRQWFPTDAWVHGAANSYRNDQQYLFFQNHKEHQLDPVAGSDTPQLAIDINPIAMLWMDDNPNTRPIVATADSARLILSEPYSASEGTIGRIVRGWLTGNVIIQGPKGLRITGQEFSVDEESLKLSSIAPVEFWWDGHHGLAKGGVEIDLERDNTKDPGLTSVRDISAVTLVGPVHCDLAFEGQRRNQEDTELTIIAPSRFEFDLTRNIGTFHGLRGSKDFRHNHVRVERHTKGKPDTLFCPQLIVEFHPKIRPDTGDADENRLELGRVRARGNPNRDGEVVRYSSPQNNIIAGMMELDYQVGAKQLDMYGSLQRNGQSLNPTKKIRIIQQNRELRVPHLHVLHGDGNGIERIECRGPGHVVPSPHALIATKADSEDEDAAEVVRWYRQLIVQRSPDRTTHTISIRGDGSVSLPERQMSLAGEAIDLTLLTKEASTDSSDQTTDDISLSMTDAEPKLLIASGDVIVKSPRVSGELKDQLTVHFHEKDRQGTRQVAVVSQTTDLTTDSSNDTQPRSLFNDRESGHSTFNGREMTANVILASEPGDQQQWRSVHLNGDVKVTHEGNDSDQHYTAVGSTFIAENGIGDLANLKLFGNPAQLQSSAGSLRGARIDLNQEKGVARIPGGGRLQMILDQDFNGKQLPLPVPVDIRWTDEMKVHGDLAEFVGSISIVAEDVQYSISDSRKHNTRIETPELKVRFAEPLNLAGRQSDTGIVRSSADSSAPEIEEIACIGDTIIHRESFTDGKHDGLVDGEMVDLVVSPKTGEFSAIGPGWIESTDNAESNSDSSRKSWLQPVKQVRVGANKRTYIRKSPYSRVKVSFIGGITGNLQLQQAHLYNSVDIAFAPVHELDERLDLESMPADQMPPDSRILQANEVDVSAIPGEAGDQYQMRAVGNAKLISRDLSGGADVITYDNSKKQIHLSAEDGRLINGRYRHGGTGPFQVIHGTRFDYNLETRNSSGNTMLLETQE